MQNGSLNAIGDTCYLKYYIIVDGKRVHKTFQLCKRDDVHDWWNKRGKWGFSNAGRSLQRATMDKIKTAAKAAEAATLKTHDSGNMRVFDFWERVYLAQCENIVELMGQPRRKPSTVRGFKQIWKSTSEAHFGNVALIGGFSRKAPSSSASRRGRRQ
jgi:hypothetical protein